MKRREKGKIDKVAFRKFLDKLFEKRLQKHLELMNEDIDGEEVCIEPFAFIDADGDVLPIMQYEELTNEEIHEFKNLCDLESCPGLELDDEVKINEDEINEDEIAYMPIEEVELDESEFEAFKKMADQIEPIEDICIPCYVNGKENYLVNGVNCNVKNISILGLLLVTPINVEILKVYIDSDMKSEEEIEVTVAIKSENNMVVYKFCMGDLLDAGIVSVVNDVELELSPVEYRGVVKPVNAEELTYLLS